MMGGVWAGPAGEQATSPHVRGHQIKIRERDEEREEERMKRREGDGMREREGGREGRGGEGRGGEGLWILPNISVKISAMRTCCFSEQWFSNESITG